MDVGSLVGPLWTIENDKTFFQVFDTSEIDFNVTPQKFTPFSTFNTSGN